MTPPALKRWLQSFKPFWINDITGSRITLSWLKQESGRLDQIPEALGDMNI